MKSIFLLCSTSQPLAIHATPARLEGATWIQSQVPAAAEPAPPRVLGSHLLNLGRPGSRPVTWRGRRPRGPLLPGVQARPDRLFALQREARAPVAQGPAASRLRSAARPHPQPHPPCHLVLSPEWAAGVPLPPPATAPPRSAGARSLHRHQKIQRVFNARKRNASCFPSRPPCRPPPRSEATPGASEHAITKVGAPRAGAAGRGARGGRGRGHPRATPDAAASPSICRGPGRPGGGTKLQGAGPRRGPRATQSGVRPGRGGRAQRLGARAASGPRGGGPGGEGPSLAPVPALPRVSAAP